MVMVVAVVVPAAPGALVVRPLRMDGPALAVEVAVQGLPIVPAYPVVRQPLALAPELLLLVLEAVGLAAGQAAVVDALLDPVLLVVVAAPELVRPGGANERGASGQGEGGGESEPPDGAHG